MVFCKSAADSPRKARSVSPRRFSGRCSPTKRLFEDLGSLEMINSPLQCVYNSKSALGRLAASFTSLPKKDVRILEAMAKKKAEERIRGELADRFNDMWLREAEERKKMDVEVAVEYSQYVAQKRHCHRRQLQRRQLELDMQQDLERSRLAQDARERHERSRHLLEVHFRERKRRAWVQQACDAARSQDAALRRCDLEEEEEARRRGMLAVTESRGEAADRRRTRTLKELSYRAAVSSGLSQTESARRHREVEVAELIRREELRAGISAKEERVRRLERERTSAIAKSRQVAALTASLRETLR